jgi:hypothetical protein
VLYWQQIGPLNHPETRVRTCQIIGSLRKGQDQVQSEIQDRETSKLKCIPGSRFRCHVEINPSNISILRIPRCSQGFGVPDNLTVRPRRRVVDLGLDMLAMLGQYCRQHSDRRCVTASLTRRMWVRHLGLMTNSRRVYASS